MTEVPEHLLQKAREARARLTGVGGDAPASGDSAAADTGAAVEKAPAAAAPVAAPPVEIEKAPEPVPPFVQAALDRKKVPSWAFFIVLMLPIWAFFYVGTLERPPEQGVFQAGEEVYAACAGCHGGGGGGGTGRQLSGGEVALTFPDAASHVWWVINGSPAAGTPYGDPGRPGGQRLSLSYSGAAMGGVADALSAIEILEVVYYERVAHGELDADGAEFHALEELIEHAGDYAVPEEFEVGTTIEELQGFIDAAIEELGLEGEA